MVEFGLKLQDNQVSDWSQHYIAYENLKTLLKRAKAARARYEENAKKKPALAAEIKSNYEQGINTFLTTTPPVSAGNLSNIVKNLSSGSLKEQQVSSAVAAKTSQEGKDNEKVALLKKTDSAGDLSNYGSQADEKGLSTSSSHGILNKAVSSVSEYFEKRYETSLRDTLKEIDRLNDDFDHLMMEEVCRRTKN